ncbi:dihydroorotate dehydrogenase (NAD+) catalytic subunit [Nocardioides alpinus]|uniref:Dihydroorotate dehydrogenase n=1 Tax=Nocardioides alpinus TaxID=748909 RepID=A0A1I1B115_9ACTN|nr:nitronate monooxygenase [Nocardioides alpinus]PKH41454.1 dihydroorotate dehydrogenase [Nocardioides alpinus]SFB43326.1 dihydroorotate dehydrogenase (NAD+) catalytic subunit [Nocardioides alpinus]
MSARVPGPVMVAAGCGGTGRELEPYLGPAGLDGLDFVTRSITLDARPGGPGPRLVEVPGGIVNAVGLPNPGLEHFLATELPWLVRAGARVIVSIAGATMGEYADLARRLSRAPGVAGLEVNVGAPDEVGVGLFEVREPYHSASVIAAVRREFPADRPVLAKLRPDVSRIVEGARSCHEAGATAVVVGNAVPAAFPDGRAGGLSGPAIAPIALRCVATVHQTVPEVPLIACGGVRDAASATAYLRAGASAVQVGTALLHDPTTLARLRADLETSHQEDP